MFMVWDKFVKKPKKILLKQRGMWDGFPWADQESIENFKKRWLVLPKSLFTIDGNECNKIGISWSGFRNQNGDHCSEEPNTCLHSQLDEYAVV